MRLQFTIIEQNRTEQSRCRNYLSVLVLWSNLLRFVEVSVRQLLFIEGMTSDVAISKTCSFVYTVYDVYILGLEQFSHPVPIHLTSSWLGMPRL